MRSMWTPRETNTQPAALSHPVHCHCPYSKSAASVKPEHHRVPATPSLLVKPVLFSPQVPDDPCEVQDGYPCWTLSGLTSSLVSKSRLSLRLLKAHSPASPLLSDISASSLQPFAAGTKSPAPGCPPHFLQMFPEVPPSANQMWCIHESKASLGYKRRPSLKVK